MKPDWLGSLVGLVLRMDPGGRARLRRGGDEPDVLLLPGLAQLLSGREGVSLTHAITTARIAAILGEEGASHPGAALAKAGLAERRMGRLLASDPEVLPDRLIAVARFLAAQRGKSRVAPFYWLMNEVEWNSGTRTRAEWARRYSDPQTQNKPQKDAAK